MNEIDEFLINLQTGIVDLYHKIRKAEEIYSGEKTNSQDQILMNDTWIALETTILNLEDITCKIIRQRAVTRD